MSADPVWWPGDRELVDEALADARGAGVPEAEIQRMLQEAASGPQDELATPILAGKLGEAARRARGPRVAGPSPWRAPKDDDGW